ncbi:hypothetical protein U9M48_007315 [Paspalum notatum var. saurae]|uniref:Zinc-ribbon domain-containing protein n=1 Tax=Paspalum notatum var. saurae TaxID=547442 RepID=A0AAQ3Q1C0_PASNO
MADVEGIRLVRCPKCLNILPEPPNVTVYQCGGCATTLRAKIRASNGKHVAPKQVRQDSDNYSVATSVGVPPQKEDQGSIGAIIERSFNADAPSTAHDSNGTRVSENGGDMLAEQNAVLVDSPENKEEFSFEGQDTNSRMEGPAGLANPIAYDTYLDSGEAENHTVEQPADDSQTCRAREEDDDAECHLNISENNKMLSSETNKAAVSMQDSEQKEADEAEHAANKKSHLVRVLSRSCDLRASVSSLDFHSSRTSLQSKSFRASEPLQSKIMNTVDELKGDLSELFNKPAGSKPKAYPPRPSKQDGHTARGATTSSAPLAAYRPSAMHSGYAPRPSRSGQVAAPRQIRSGQAAPRGLPSMRYRRHRVYSCHHSVQMEMMRPCRHECCHSCQPPCYRSCRQEPGAMRQPPTKEIKRRPPPRNHCLPVLRGAPFVICSSCASLVQLPTDFAVPRRGTRRLRCGSCSEVLSYSYRDPGRKKPRSPFGGDDEYSTDDYDYEIRRHHQAAAGGFEQADPVSYSEEYGLSFGVSQSTSTEGGPPLYVSRNSSFNTVDERTGRDGKLHRLLGYSSASELLRHSPDLFESFDGRTPSVRAHKPNDARTHDVDRKGKGVCVAENDAVKRPKARRGGLPLHGILKKGIHGLESLKRRS